MKYSILEKKLKEMDRRKLRQFEIKTKFLNLITRWFTNWKSRIIDCFHYSSLSHQITSLLLTTQVSLGCPNI